MTLAELGQFLANLQRPQYIRLRSGVAMQLSYELAYIGAWGDAQTILDNMANPNMVLELFGHRVSTLPPDA